MVWRWEGWCERGHLRPEGTRPVGEQMKLLEEC